MEVMKFQWKIRVLCMIAFASMMFVFYLKARANKLLTQFLRHASIILVSTIILNVCNKQFLFLAAHK